MIDLKRPDVVKVSFEGKELSLSQFNLGQAAEIESEIAAMTAEKKPQMPFLMHCLESAGLPQDIVHAISLDSMQQLIDLLLPKKKN